MTRYILITIALTMACVFAEPVAKVVWWLSKAPIELARW